MNITGYEYFPMTDGLSCVYQVLYATGQYQANGELWIVGPRTPMRQEVITFSQKTSPLFLGNQTLYRMYYHNTGTSGLPPYQELASLIDGQAISSNGFPYLGEYIDQYGGLKLPPEPILPKNPFVGQTIDIYSRVYQDENSMIVRNPAYHSKLTVLKILPNWGAAFPGPVVWTSLREYNSPPTIPDHVYNYVFQLNRGLVDFWHGELQPNNQVAVREFFLIDEYQEA